MARVEGDSSAATEFLKRFHPDGPWALTAIQPDRKAIETRTFHPSGLKELDKWLAQYNGSRNIYFHVNPPLRDITKKAEREDIKEVSWLHVDIDPRAGEDIGEEQERALGLLTTKLPKGVPEPTCVVFSGGGYQGFWRLEEPIPVEGELARAEDAKRYNQQLELAFGADNCHNIDRIMRLPGTVNLPDARKARKGRVPTLATLVSLSDATYPLNTFTPAPAVQTQDEGWGVGGEIKISGDIERLASVDELDQWGVSDRVKIIIVQGRHPEERKEGDDSRSAWLFDAICQLVRAEVPDEVIFSIITDPDFGISESVIDKGANAEKYALRQIGRGRDEAVDPWLRRFNDRYAVIGNLGGKCRIVYEELDLALDRTVLVRQSFEDFRNKYMHEKVTVGVDKDNRPIEVPAGKWWLSQRKRRQYENIVFVPGREVNGSYNMWKGYACLSIPGECGLILDHLRDNVCSGDEELADYLIKWLARTVQQPASPGEVAIVLRGGRGVGKSFFAKEFGKLWGRHFMHISNPAHLVGNFNSHMRDCVVLFADEAFYAGDRKHASILKTLITEETIAIEAKGVDVETSPNYIHLLMASNDTHVIPAGGDERRFLVLDVGTGAQKNSSYFAAISKQMNEGGREALLNFLMGVDISDFDVRAVPATDALREQKLLSLNFEEDWWYQKLEEGRVLLSDDEWSREVMKEALVDDFIRHTDRFRVSRRGSQTALGRFLQKVCPRLSSMQRMAEIEIPVGDGWSRKVERRTYFYVVPDLETCRARWEELHGPQDWMPVVVEPMLRSKEREREPF